ncbi:MULTISPECIES: hypothetical protein [unclassified Acinetobacter]|uniref:hypothetical protein n=1 Tax=unclassified Acinetobacter TaxID=196816 RepID=UPI0029348498|nr:MULTISPECIES: hypothetical protein [unclassified Acinetobacter]WOE32273.1 hypothetical protein QSG84_03415 [Acinetobacter sp. SAAs470]WOE37743.1 hypothetical protein QSG86_12460 [Acinetobacter sp. SAAs474]
MLQGFDNIEYKVKNSAIEKIDEYIPTTGTSVVSLKVTKSLSEFYEALDISAAMSASYAAGAKASLAKKIILQMKVYA